MTFRPRFGTDLTDIPRNKIVNVENVNAFPNRVGDVVTLENDTKYNFTKQVDLGDIEFVIPDNGNIEITSDNIIANTLSTDISSGTTLFTGDVARLIIRNIDITFTSDGDLFNIQPTTSPLPLIQLQNGRFTGAGGSLGSITDALVLVRESALINWSSGFVFDSNGIIDIIGVAVIECNFVNVSGTQIVIEGAHSFVTIQNCLSRPTSGGAFLNLSSTLTKMQVTSDSIFVQNNTINIDGGGTFLEAGSLDSTEPGVSFVNNINTTESNIIASAFFTGNTTATTISAVNTPVKVVGITTAGNLERFSHSSGRLTYTGQRDFTLRLEAYVTIKVGPELETSTIATYIYKNGVQVASTVAAFDIEAVFQTPTSPMFISVDNVLMENGDFFECFIENQTDDTNITVTTLRLAADE